jgi:hypothetical protein
MRIDKIIKRTLEDMGCSVVNSETLSDIRGFSYLYRVSFNLRGNENNFKCATARFHPTTGPIEIISKFYEVIKAEELTDKLIDTIDCIPEEEE